MKALFDTEPIELTDGYLAALKNLMREEIVMMRLRVPEDADCWTWGVCHVGDIAHNSLKFEFGGDEDKPVWLKTDVAVKAEASIS